MKNVKALTVKNMKETLVNDSHSQKEFNRIWDTFYQMFVLRYISISIWVKFFENCRGWYYDKTCDCIRDALFFENLDGLVWKYTPDSKYHA